METRFLRTFLMVADTESLAEAARRLNITPSAVAQRLRALEEEVGRPLVQRAGQRMQPTAAGAAIVRDVRHLLDVEDAVKAAVSADLGTGLLRVGLIHTMLTGVLPDLIAALRRSRPGIELYILPGTSGELFARVGDGSLDAAIIVRPPFALPKAYRWRLLRREPLLLITPPTVSGADPSLILRREPFIRYDRNHWGGRIVDLYLRRLRVRPNEQYELDSLEAITVLVSRGVGVSLVPDWLPPWPEGALVRRTPLPRAPTRDLGIVWSSGSRRLPLIDAFVDELVGIASAGTVSV